jgi:quercetin dioxygenase-like cupin family protein
LFIKQGRYLSYHHHEKKDEVLFIESGKINFTHDMNGEPQTLLLSEGYAFHVTPNIVHQMEAIVDTVIYEFSTKHLDEDSFRTTTDLVLGKKVNLDG